MKKLVALIERSKFRAGDIIYYKYPSRYTRQRSKDCVEAILHIKQVFVEDIAALYYKIRVVKLIHCPHKMHFTTLGSHYTVKVDAQAVDTYSRKLTAAEKILYG